MPDCGPLLQPALEVTTPVNLLHELPGAAQIVTLEGLFENFLLEKSEQPQWAEKDNWQDEFELD